MSVNRSERRGSPRIRRPNVTEEDRPVVQCFVSKEVTEGVWTEPALVDLDTAYDLKQSGWICIGPDPDSVAALDEWLAARQWLKKLG